jgi:surface repeat SSSPR-51 protein
MKKNLFKVTTCAMLATTALGFAAPLAQPLNVFADEVVANATNAKSYAELVDEARKAGVQVTEKPEKVFTDKAEYDKHVSEQVKALEDAIKRQASAGDVESKDKEALEKYNAELKAYNEQMAARQKAIAEYSTKKKEAEGKSSKYKEELKAYEAKLAEYNKALDEATKNAKKDGYLSQPESQDLIFKREPNAKLSVSGNTIYLDAADAVGGMGVINASAGRHIAAGHQRNTIQWQTVNNPGAVGGGSGESGQTQATVLGLEQGKTTTVTYDGLQNSTFKGRKISKVVYDYTLESSPSNDNTVTAVVYQDPTITIYFGTNRDKQGVDTKIRMKATFYYEDGSKVNLADGSALFSFASLNYTNQGFNEQEYVGVTDSIQPIQITGSSIVYKDGKLGATSSNNTKSEGSKFERGEWDSTADNPNSYYGAGAAKATAKAAAGSVEFIIGNHPTANPARGTQRQWFQFNSEVRSNTLPPKPSAPVPYNGEIPEDPSKTPEPKKPEQPKPSKEGSVVSVEVTPARLQSPEKPAEKVITKHIDITTGKEISKQEEGKQPKKDIPGYEFVETKDEGGNTIHYYKPVEKPAEKVITKHIDITTGKEISKQEDGKQPKKDIPGYEFVETKDEGGNTLHYYKPVEKKETPKELPKTSEQSKQRTTAVLGLLSVVGLGGFATYFGLRKRNEN